MLGNPFGIDNAYLALFVPLAVMGLSEIVKRVRKGSVAASPAES
jgi:SSS family solute:Na+ symporter